MKELRYTLALLISLSCVRGHSQELSTLRDEVRAPQASPSRSDSDSGKPPSQKKPSRSRSFFGSSDECDHDPDDDESLNSYFGKLAGSLLLWGASTPFTIPRAMVGDQGFEAGYPLRYPYLHDRQAALVDGLYSIEGAKTFMLRVSGEHIDDFESLSSTGGSLYLDTSHRLGVESQFTYRREDTPSLADELWTGDTNVVFRFAQSEQLQMRAGVGFQWLADEQDSEFGFNATYAGDWFPIKPLIISHELDWGTLGSSTVFHGRVTAGINYHRLETYLGYDYYDVGQADIAGMVAGVRLWLAR